MHKLTHVRPVRCESFRSRRRDIQILGQTQYLELSSVLSKAPYYKPLFEGSLLRRSDHCIALFECGRRNRRIRECIPTILTTTQNEKNNDGNFMKL